MLAVFIDVASMKRYLEVLNSVKDRMSSYYYYGFCLFVCFFSKIRFFDTWTNQKVAVND